MQGESFRPGREIKLIRFSSSGLPPKLGMVDMQQSLLSYLQGILPFCGSENSCYKGSNVELGVRGTWFKFRLSPLEVGAWTPQPQSPVLQDWANTNNFKERWRLSETSSKKSRHLTLLSSLKISGKRALCQALMQRKLGIKTQGHLDTSLVAVNAVVRAQTPKSDTCGFGSHSYHLLGMSLSKICNYSEPQCLQV